MYKRISSNRDDYYLFYSIVTKKTKLHKPLISHP